MGSWGRPPGPGGRGDIQNKERETNWTEERREDELEGRKKDMATGKGRIERQVELNMGIGRE